MDIAMYFQRKGPKTKTHKWATNPTTESIMQPNNPPFTSYAWVNHTTTCHTIGFEDKNNNNSWSIINSPYFIAENDVIKSQSLIVLEYLIVYTQH